MTKPITDYLFHRCNIVTLTPGAKDEYGMPTFSETETSVDCFLDYPDEEIKIKVSKEVKIVAGILFLEPDATIRNGDLIRALENSGGQSIDPKEYKVSGMIRANDDSGVHHLEVYLTLD